MLRYPLLVLERFVESMARLGIDRQSGPILIGYSGGADSTCLLQLAHRAGFNVVAAHLHHGQRPEADKEMSLCNAFADELGVPFVSGRADVPRMVKDLKIGIEEAGRMARYQFFRSARRSTETKFIATAHTKSDSVETILFNLARGTGSAGLSGIEGRTADEIVRPLLPFTRDETRAYCDENGLWYHDDPSNFDLDLSRARIRHRIGPEFAAINPRYEDAIVRAAEIIDEEHRFLNGAAAAALERCEVPTNGQLGFLTRDCEIRFDRSALTQLPAVLFKRSIRLAVSALQGSLDYHQTNLVLQALSHADHERHQTGSVTTEGAEVEVVWSQDAIHVRQSHPTEPFRYKLTVPGETESEEFGWKFTATPRPLDQAYSRTHRDSLNVVISRAGMKGELYFRSAQPGDRLSPVGFEGHRKVSDLLSEAKLTPAARARLPIVCDLVGPIWIPGVCFDQRVASTSELADDALYLSFGPL